MTYSQRNIEALFFEFSLLSKNENLNESIFSVISTPNSIWPNLIYNLSCSSEELKTVFAEIKNNPNLPNLVMMNPLIHSEEYISEIDKLGVKKGAWYAMSKELIQPISLPKIKGFVIKEVSNKNELKQWLTIAKTELMNGENLNRVIFEKLMVKDDFRFYLGLFEGKPVCTSFSYMKYKEVGVYLVSTRKEYRKKGFGKLIALHCIKEAHEKGCKQAILQATEIGTSVYEAIGFKNEGKIHVYNLTG